MLGNLSQSMASLQSLLAGFGYLLGILFIIGAVLKFKSIGDAHSKGKKFVAFAYLIVGALLLFLPTTITVISNTTFGTGSIIQYSAFSQFDVMQSMIIILKTAGILWFVRGCVLLAHSSEPGEQHGPKGLAFIFAGIMAMNFESTTGALQYVLNHLMLLLKSPLQ